MSMNWAILGNVENDLLRAITKEPDWQLLHLVGQPPNAAEFQQLAPQVAIHSSWEPLLTDDHIDALIVAASDATTLEAARHVAGAGIPLIVCPEYEQGAGWIYELSLIRDDTGVPLVPFLPASGEFAVLKELLSGSDVGKPVFLQWERIIQQSAASKLPVLKKSEINQRLLADVFVCRHLLGNFNQVTAVHTGTTEQGISVANCKLGGNDLPEFDWTLRGTNETPISRMTLQGEKGRVVLTMNEEDRSLLVDGTEVPSPTVPIRMEAVIAELRRCQRFIEGKRSKPDWEELTRMFETVDATHRSIRRRRTIDLYFEATSERNQFKTQMTAIGCGVLCLTLVMIVFAMMLGAMPGIPKWVMHVARVLVFLPLFIFLILQGLYFVTRPSIDERAEEGSCEE